MDKLSQNELIQIARREVERYAGVSHNATAYPLLDDLHRTYAVNAIKQEICPDRAWIIVQARIQDDWIVIDEDNVFDKKLVYALESAGVPREQIVLAYEGEQIPTLTEQAT